MQSQVGNEMELSSQVAWDEVGVRVWGLGFRGRGYVLFCRGSSR